MAKGRHSTACGLRLQDNLLGVIEELARDRGLTRNELIVELVKLGLDNCGKEIPPPGVTVPRPIDIETVGRKPVSKVTQPAGLVTKTGLKANAVRREDG